ncbi:hypothetical protein DPMN_010011 [Dreissena polymorpha]|uniref:Uncharacterized protein n=1 Tax=Dreissena polymorpha TaxID=45954 RepID=A0A9D4MZ51_DREPO|nr:hypothetical protein DPMN_010011 [Dreissena polymorpha]
MCASKDTINSVFQKTKSLQTNASSQFQISIAVSIVVTCTSSPALTLLEQELANLPKHLPSILDYVNASVHAFYEQPACDPFPSSSAAPFFLRALCPWDYEMNTDLNRFPPVLTVAKCKCRTCLNSEEYKCSPVLYSVQVLKQECNHGIKRWIRKTELIPVACTCIQPLV